MVTDKQGECMVVTDEEVTVALNNTVCSILKLLEKASERELNLTYQFIKSIIRR